MTYPGFCIWELPVKNKMHILYFLFLFFGYSNEDIIFEKQIYLIVKLNLVTCTNWKWFWRISSFIDLFISEVISVYVSLFSFRKFFHNWIQWKLSSVSEIVMYSLCLWIMSLWLMNAFKSLTLWRSRKLRITNYCYQIVKLFSMLIQCCIHKKIFRVKLNKDWWIHLSILNQIQIDMN
jgi:hypothetical protein